MVSAWASDVCLVLSWVFYKWLLFYTKAHDNNCTVQNSEVTLIAQSMHILVPKATNQCLQICQLRGDGRHMGVRLHYVLCSRVLL